MEAFWETIGPPGRVGFNLVKPHAQFPEEQGYCKFKVGPEYLSKSCWLLSMEIAWTASTG